MIRVLSLAEYREAEDNAKACGLSDDILIESAARETADFVRGLGKSFAVLAGGGNNGADALSVARLLLLRGKKVRIFLPCEKMNENAAKRLSAYKSLGGRLGEGSDLGVFDVIVDGIFGSGLSRAPEGEARLLIESANDAAAVRVAVDIPSGLSADTGMALGAVFKADYTVTFSHLKTGLVLGGAVDCVGRLVVADIGIRAQKGAFLADGSLLPARKRKAHKYDFGSVKIVGGCESFVGAPLMAYESAVAATLGGAGLVTLCVPRSLQAAYLPRVKQSMFLPLPDTEGALDFDEESCRKIIDRADAVAIGMGLKESEGLRKIIAYLCASFHGALILDAAALSAAASNPETLRQAAAKVILTPHAGEFRRLIGKNGPLSDFEAVTQAKSLAAQLNCVVVYKDCFTYVTDGVDGYYSLSGTPAMAKGGTGDVLAGKIAALCKVLPPLKAAAFAAFSQGKKGEAAARIKGENALTCDDLY